MSVRHIAEVLDRYPGGDHLKLTLLALADAADSHTGECWPSYASIAGRTNKSRRTAIRNVDALMAEGVIDIVQRGGKRIGQGGRKINVTNVYRVRMDVLSTYPHWREIQPVDNGSSGVTDDTTPSDTQMSPPVVSSSVTPIVRVEPSLESSVEPDAETGGQTLRDQRHAESTEARDAARAGLRDWALRQDK